MIPSIGKSLPNIGESSLQNLMEEAGPVLRAAIERRSHQDAEFTAVGFQSFIPDES